MDDSPCQTPQGFHLLRLVGGFEALIETMVFEKNAQVLGDQVGQGNVTLEKGLVGVSPEDI